MEAVPAHDRGLEIEDLQGPLHPNHSVILWKSCHRYWTHHRSALAAAALRELLRLSSLCKEPCSEMLSFPAHTALAAAGPRTSCGSLESVSWEEQWRRKADKSPFPLDVSMFREHVCHSMNILISTEELFPHYGLRAAWHGWFHTWLLQMMLQVTQSFAATQDKNLPAAGKARAVFIRAGIHSNHHSKYGWSALEGERTNPAGRIQSKTENTQES